MQSRRVQLSQVTTALQGCTLLARRRAVTQHATDVQRKNALPAPLDHRMGAGPDIDAAEAHGVPGRHRRRHEGASGRCRRDRGVREATDWPKRRCNTMLRHLERW